MDQVTLISFIGMLLGIAVFVFMIFKRFPLPVGAIVAAIVVAVFSGMPVLSTLSTTFMEKAAGAFKSYLVLLVSSAVFGQILGDAGACQSIAYKMARLARKAWPGHEKFLGVLSMGLITAIFCYGGISVFVVIFTLIYVGKELYEELDIPWYMLTVTGMGTGSTVAMLPGSPQLTNIVPMEFFGTPAYSAPVLGIICAVFSFVLSCLWISYKVKTCVKKGEGFMPAAADFMKTWQEPQKVKEMPLWKALIPSIALVLALNFTSYGAVFAVWVGIIVAALLYNPFKLNWVKDCVGAVGSAAGSLTALAAATGFGGVVAACAGYQWVVGGLMNLPGSNTFKVFIAVNICCAICGSGSTGLRVCLGSLGDYFSTLGIAPQALHRLCTITACGLDTLPHSAGMSTTYVLGKIPYKDGYINHFMLTVVITVLSTLLCMLLMECGINF